MRLALWVVRLCMGTVLGLATWAVFAQVDMLTVLRQLFGALSLF